MKEIFYFVRKLSNFSPDDVVYKVRVGHDKLSIAKHTLLKCYAEDNGLYYQIVSDSSDKAICQLAEGVFHQGRFSSLLLRSVAIDVCDLYRMVIDDSFARFEARLSLPKAYFQQMICFGINTDKSKSKSSIKKHTPGSTRKYLSDDSGESLSHALISFAVIMIIFLVCGFIEGHQGVLF